MLKITGEVKKVHKMKKKTMKITMSDKRRTIHNFITSVQFMEKGLQSGNRLLYKHLQKKLCIPVNYFGG